MSALAVAPEPEDDGPDINDRIAKLVEEWTPEGDFVAAVQAQKLVAHLQETAPDALDEWLHANAVVFLADLFRWRSRSRRARTLHQAKRRAFSDAAEAAEDGDEEPLKHFATFHVVDAKGTQRRVADMTGDDHRFVAEKYTVSSKTAAMQAKFHTVVAKKAGKNRTQDVLTDDEYDRLYQSIVKRT